MNDWDDEILRALVHPVRRRIIECLEERKFLSFNELLKCTAMLNHGRLGFHLRALKPLVRHEALTRKYRLTRRGQLAAELIWHMQFTMAKTKPDLTHEPTRYVRHLRLGDHAAFFYDTEDIKRAITFPFLKAGLQRGEAVAYVISENKMDSEKREIQRYGISVDNLGKRAFMIISADEWYIKKGKSQAKTIIDNWLTLVKEKQKAGFRGLRVAADMEVFFHYAKRQELLRYEATLGKQLAPTVGALCLYDTHRLEEKEFIHLNHSHGHSIFKGVAFKTTNPH